MWEPMGRRKPLPVPKPKNDQTEVVASRDHDRLQRRRFSAAYKERILLKSGMRLNRFHAGRHFSIRIPIIGSGLCWPSRSSNVCAQRRCIVCNKDVLRKVLDGKVTHSDDLHPFP